jgi:hypothetical protein
MEYVDGGTMEKMIEDRKGIRICQVFPFPKFLCTKIRAKNKKHDVYFWLDGAQMEPLNWCQ